VVLDRAGGRVLGIEVDTADDREAVLARGRIHLAEDRSLLDLLRDLRGRRVRVEGTDGSALVATAVGVDLEVEDALERWRRAGLLAPESAAVLDRLLDLQRQVAEAAERKAYADRGRALERQEQLGKALAPLGTTGREAELRERYVTELGSLEDRLAELDRVAAEARIESERRRGEIRALLR
jgi:hypothetical protein